MHTGIQVGRCDLDQEIAAIDREPVAVFVERLGRQGRQFVAPSGRGASVLPVPHTGDEFAIDDVGQRRLDRLGLGARERTELKWW